MTSVAVNEAGYTTLDGNGNGTLKMVPDGGGTTWQPASVSVKCSTNNSEATCQVYIGPTPDDAYFVDGTLSGSSGDSTTNVAGYQVDTRGNSLWAVWSGGDPGAQATMQVSGTGTIP